MSLGHLPPRLSDAEALALGRQLDPAVEARMLVAQAGGTRVSRGWTIAATADICGLDQPPAEAWVDHACTIGLLDRNDATLRLAGAPNQRHRPLHPAELAAAQAAVREHELERRHIREEQIR